jgi:PKD repeat protein/pimeloyl-ACP methyl ester carboxylesterase
MLAGFGLLPLSAQETPPLLEAGKVQVTASAERSTLNRVTGVLTSAVDIEATNLSGQRIDGPIHAIIAFKTPEGVAVREAVTVPGTLGGFGKAPWQQPFFDLTAQLGADGWQPGTVLRLPLSFSRARTLSVLYEVTFAGRVNHEPVVNPGGPYTGRVGSEITFTGAATDPDGDPVTFAWDFGSGAGAPTAEASRAFATAGAPRVTLTVNDGRGGVVVRDVTVLVAPPGAFALAHTRIVDGTGHPLGSVQVTETGPLGSREFAAGDEGFVSLGLTAGNYGWTFSAPGHRPVHRQAALTDGAIKLLPSPWLAREGGPAEVSVLETTTLTAGNSAVRLTFPAGAFTQPGAARLTPLGPQTLPFPLPFGWSPLAAFHLDLPETPTLPAAARLKLAELIAADEILTLVRFDETARVWRVIKTGQADQARRDEFNFSLGESGSVAVLVRDAGPGAPPIASIGDPLPAGTPQNLESLVTAVGSVTPQEKPASLDPDAVTAVGEAIFTPATGLLPSGSWFRLGVQETYDLTDGTGLRTPDYDATMYAYRRPGPGGSTVRAAFPLRPRLLFGPAELKEAHLHVDVLPPLGDGPAALSEAGGSLGSGGFQVVIPPNALGGVAVGSLRSLGVPGFAGLAGPGFVVTGAFELNLAGLAPGTVLDFSMTTPVAPGADFILAKLVSISGGSGLAPVQRLRSNAAGVLTHAEPDSPPRLGGLNGPGQYLLVQLPAAQGLVSGVVRTSAAVPAPGIGTRVTGQPWLSVTGTDGSYFLTFPAGEGTVLASNSANGDGAAAAFTMPAALAAQEVDLTLGALAPRVLAVTPPDKALKVAVVTPLTVEFSEKISPASLGATPLTLRAAGADNDVPASFTLDLANRVVTLLPANPLDPATEYTLTVSSAIRDLQNLALEGPREFIFTTAAPAARGIGAELTIYEPGAAGPTPADRALIDAIPGYEPGTDSEKVVAVGSAGTADPSVPVILVNESTGATATVLSKNDGSFANFIEASEDDFISAVFVNANGTRISIPATRQKFDDGRVGLFRQGGILEAEGDGSPAQVIVEPNSVPSRTVFRFEQVTVAKVLEITKGVEPESGKVLGGIQFEEHGERTTVYSDVVFPVKVADLGLPAGTDPATAAFALTVPREINGTVVFEIIDAMNFRATNPGKGELVTASPPFVGLLLREIAALRKETGLRDGIAENLSRTIADGAISSIVPTGAMAVPVLLGTVEVSNLHGTTYVETPAAADAPEGTPGARSPLAGAVVRLGPPGLELLPDVFTAGTFIAVSDPQGKYVLRLPGSLSALASATHKRFPGQVVRTGFGSAGGISGKRADFVFIKEPPKVLEIEDTSPPSITIRQLSLVATVGETPGAGIVLDETATDDLRIASASGPKLFSFTPIVGGNPIEVDSAEKLLLEGFDSLRDDAGLPTTLHRQWRLRSKRSGRAVYRFEASDGVVAVGESQQEARITTVDYTVVFSTTVAPPEDPELPPRVVSFAWPPAEAENIARGTPLILRFSRPLTQVQAENTSWIKTGDGASILHVDIAPDFREIHVAYWLTDPAAEKINFTIEDLTVARRNPGQLTSDSGETTDAASQFTHSFSFAAKATLETNTDAILAGGFGGVVQLGSHVWVLERGTESGKLLHYEIVRNGDEAGLEARSADTFEFHDGEGRPMDLILIPGYALASVDGVAAKEETYLAVLAGPLQGNDPGLAASKRAHIFRITSAGKPEPFLIRGESPVLTDTTSLITRGRWDPPFMSYLEIGETTSVSLLTFNGLVQEARDRLRLAALPKILRIQPDRVNGLDLDNDGDFADAGERAPNRGLEFTWTPLSGQERIVDYDFSADFGLMGAVLRPLGAGANMFAMVLGGKGQVDDETARVSFNHAAKRMKLLPRQRLTRPVQTEGAVAQLFLGQSNNDIVRDIALVSCVNGNPGTDRSVLVVIDITNPAAPQILIEATLPLGIGSLNSIVPREDGLLAVSATGGGMFLLDPTLLLAADAEGRTAALRQQIPGLESNVNTFASSADGYNFANLGNQITTAITQPSITVLKPRFTDKSKLRSAQGIVDEVRGTSSPIQRENWDRFLLDYEATGLGGNAGVFDPEKPEDPQRHFYVVVKASGLAADADGHLPLAMAAVSSYGKPLLPSLSNRAPTFVGNTSISKALVGYAALKAAHFLAEVDIGGEPSQIATNIGNQLLEEAEKSFLENGFIKRFLDGAPDYPEEMVARRLSDDPTSPLFNTYVAGPIVLLHQDAPKALVGDEQQNALKRTFLRASPFFWVGLAPTLRADPFVGHFASKQLDDLDLEVDASPAKLIDLTKNIGNILIKPKHPIMAITQIALELSTAVDGEFQRTFEPGHVALVNFGFRRNPVVFIPGVMASRLINPAVEHKDRRLRWLSIATAARAHARELLSSVAPAALAGQIATVEENLNKRMADLTILPAGVDAGGNPLPVRSAAPLDTEDILRTVGLGQVVADLRADSILKAIGEAVSGLFSAFGIDLPSSPSGPLVDVILNKVNKPIYEPLLIYLNGYLGMDEYKHEGRNSGLRLKGSGAVDPASGLALTADPNWESLETGPELFIFPYDWRLDNADSARKLAEFIELINVVHPDAPKVDLVCHSMGGLVARRYVLEHPNRVDRFISINSPFLGATKTLSAMKTGDMGELTMSVFVPQPRMKILTRHMPAVHQLLPSKELLDLGLPVLQENGWDLDGDGNAFENLDYEGYTKALDGPFFRIPADEIDATVSRGPGGQTDRTVLSAQPRPIATNNEPFHSFPANSRRQADWRSDSPDVRYTHFVSLQNQAATIMGLEARPVLIPEKLKANVSLSLPPVDFFETEERIGEELPILPEVTRAIEVDSKKTFRMTWLAEVLHGGGDGTVPFLSQARGFGIAGSAGNLNSRTALMFPIHNPEEEQGDDALAGHNDCMRNPQLWAWVGKALQDEIVTTAQPTLTLSGGTARENEATTFNAVIGNNDKALVKPAGRAAPTERIVWDMGDGTVIQGAAATHAYRRAGTYTVTCTLSYQPGAAVTTNPATGEDSGSRPESLRDVGRRPTFGAVQSMKVTVQENDPTLAIDGPADVGAGALAVYQLNLQGRGAEDGRVFRWSFGDGTAVDPGDADNYVVQHVYAAPGGHTLKAELLAADGTVLQQATKAITVHFPDAVPAPLPTSPAPAPLPRMAGNPQGVDRATELIELEVTGHTADPDDLEVRHDGKLVHLGTRVVQVTNGATASMPSAGHDRDSAQVPGAQSILITRDPPDVEVTTVRLHGERARLLARSTYFRLGNPLKFWYHRFLYNPSSPFASEVVFTIRWASLPTLTSSALGTIADSQGSFKLTEAAVLREADDRGPNLNPAFSDRDGGIAIRADDNALVDGDVIGDGSDQPTRNAKLMVGLPWPPGAPAVGGDGGVAAGHPLEEIQVFQANNQTATRDAVPGAISAEDRGGRNALTGSKDTPAEAKIITQADIDRITASAMKVFELATENPLLLNFVFSLDDLWLFEQGSGGNLWRTIDPAVTEAGKAVARQKLAESFVVGKSDNDYEIFLPAFKHQPSGHLSNPDDPAEFLSFPLVAHQPEYLTGDWYFKRPEGLTADGKFLGDPPDPEDREVWDRYISRTAVWLYARPVDETTIIPLERDRIAKTAGPPFNLPATPAEVIAHILTQTVKSDPELSKDLPEVSFFPVRREHLEFACLALDRPPPFGDDPIGDAGMGRQALLLKWLLEGAFLPPFEGLNGTVGGSAARRAILFDRLVERQALLAVEGYEWGVFQQWAAFRENTTFRVRPEGGSGPQAETLRARERCRQVFGNFLDAHDEKVMKKAGKAGIRAALAAMAVQPESRARLFGLSPAAFDRDPTLPSFEHFIARQAVLSPGVFDVERLNDLIDDFLKTKIGDSRKFRDIRGRPDGVDDFIFAAHDFMAGVQESTAAAYQTYQNNLLAEGRVNEFETRANNAGAIEHGFAGFSGPPVPGRLALAGLLPAGAAVPDLKYSFVVAVAKTQTERALPGLRVALEVESQRTIICPPLAEPAITLPAAAKVFTIKNVDPITKEPLLTLRRPAKATGALLPHRIALTIEDAAESASANTVVEDDAARLESEIMGVPTYRDDALIPVPTTRWVYRGLKFKPKTVSGTAVTARQQVDQLLTDQLARGVHVSPSRLAGIPDGERLAEAMTTIRNTVNAGGNLDFHNEDLLLMNTPQLLACQHLGEPEGTPNSIALSTAEDPSASIEFAAKNLQPQELGVLLAFEVPVLAQPAAEAETPDKLSKTYVQYVETATGAPRLLNPSEGREIDFFFEIKFRRCVALEIAPGRTRDPGDFTIVRHLGNFSTAN